MPNRPAAMVLTAGLVATVAVLAVPTVPGGGWSGRAFAMAAVIAVLVSVAMANVAQRPRLRRRAAPVLALAALLLLAAAAVTGVQLWSAVTAMSYPDRLQLARLPGTLSAACVLVLALCAMAIAAAVPLVRRPVRVSAVTVGLGAGVAAALAVLGLVGATLWTGAMADLGVDRTYADPPDVATPAARPGADLQVRWANVGQTPEDSAATGLAVPGRDMIVAVVEVRTAEPHEHRLILRVLDAATGHERWHYQLTGEQAPTAATPVAVDAADGRILLVSGQTGLVLDLPTGRTQTILALPRHAGSGYAIHERPTGSDARSHSAVLTGRYVLLDDVSAESSMRVPPTAVDLLLGTATPLVLSGDGCRWSLLGEHEIYRWGARCTDQSVIEFRDGRLGRAVYLARSDQCPGEFAMQTCAVVDVVATADGAVLVYAGRDQQYVAGFRFGTDPDHPVWTVQHPGAYAVTMLPGNRVAVDSRAGTQVYAAADGRRLAPPVALGDTTANASLVSNGRWYRWRAADGRLVAVDVYDAGTLRPLGRVQEVSCGSRPGVLSAADGRLVIACPDSPDIVALQAKP